jgi:hypothetical protein
MFRKFQQFLTSLTALADLTPQPFRRQWLSLVLLFTIFGLTPFSWGELVPVDITVHDSDNGAFYYQDPIQSDSAAEAQGPCSGQDCRVESVGDFVGNLKGVAKAIKDATEKARDDAARAAIRLRYASYSLHPKTLAMIALGWKKPGYEKRDPGVEGNCFKAIRKMLLDSWFITEDEWKSWRASEGKAKNAGPGLEAIGFENIFDPDRPYPFRSCADAPIGALCVYAPIDPNARRCYRSGCVEAAGHIELNLETKFPAQYSGKNPYTGKDSLNNGEYKLIGIYVNPNPLGGRRH